MHISEIKQNITIIGNNKSVEEVLYWNKHFAKDLPVALEHVKFNIDEMKKLG